MPVWLICIGAFVVFCFVWWFSFVFECGVLGLCIVVNSVVTCASFVYYTLHVFFVVLICD